MNALSSKSQRSPGGSLRENVDVVNMPTVQVVNLSKVYPVAVREPGIKGTLLHFVRRSYRAVEAVKQVSFQIESGEVVGFLGANGAGKTTTLKMLTGLIHPSAGQVRVAGFVASILIGIPVEAGRGRLVMLGWGIVFLVWNRWLWRRGLKQYSGMGA